MIFLLLANETFTFAHVNSDNIIEGKIYSNVSIYKENFESCIVEINKQEDGFFAIYDVEKYINIFKTIKEK